MLTWVNDAEGDLVATLKVDGFFFQLTLFVGAKEEDGRCEYGVYITDDATNYTSEDTDTASSEEEAKSLCISMAYKMLTEALLEADAFKERIKTAFTRLGHV